MKTKQAYELRQSGMTWQEIADEMGYKSYLNPLLLAKHYAKKNGLEWPIRRITDNESTGKTMSEFSNYRKKNVQPMRRYIPGEDLTGVSVSPEDIPEDGGMIAFNPNNPDDQWYVAKKFFEENYELA